MNEIIDSADQEFNGRRALVNVSYPYLGWRTDGGPWFNKVIGWIGSDLGGYGFGKGVNSGDNFAWWVQEDYDNDNLDPAIWNPQYASLEIVTPAAENAEFNYTMNTFDPTSNYYPKEIDSSYVMKNIGKSEESKINNRVMLARESGFTDPLGTKVKDAIGITAEVVYVGDVSENETTQKMEWSDNKDAVLKGKIIFSTGSRADLYKLAVQEGALVSVSSEVNAYNNPVINGKELYPDTVKYAGVPNDDWSATAPVAFNLSPNNERYLLKLIASSEEPVMMKAVAIGSIYPYSAKNPMKTLVAEIRGATRPDERVLFIAHVQEPGANDNATGVGTQLEMVRTLKKLIDSGKLPQPDRTMTFIWGSEYTSSYLWRDKHPEYMNNVKAALVLDMVGENTAKTGGMMRIEKTPDPSAIFQYGLDSLPGEEYQNQNEFLRTPDKHTLWGAGALEYKPYPGFFLNDLYFKSASIVSKKYTEFKVGSNPYEGGSDHDPFIWYANNFKDENKSGYIPEWNPIPALLTWHFTDYVYHTSMDTMDKVSEKEMKSVGLTTIGVGYLISQSKAGSAIETMQAMGDQLQVRFKWEMSNIDAHYAWVIKQSQAEKWSKEETAKQMSTALAEEKEVLAAWRDWYITAMNSVDKIAGDGADSACTVEKEKNMKMIDTMYGNALRHAIGVFPAN